MPARVLFWIWFLLASTAVGHLQAAIVPVASTAKISLLTCAPGSETYSLFGHSALRVSDPGRGLDRVYNYGTFDFQTPYFYWRFLRGDLRYFLSATSFTAFLESYQQENRTLTEQVLNLRPSEVQRLYEQLETTLHSPARYYRYQFFADNCTTRLFDLLSTSVEAPLQLDSSYTPAPLTHRQLLAPYLRPAPWVNLGMNLGLGWPADRPTNFRQRLFLPTELQQALAHVTRLQQPVVAYTRQLYVAVPLSQNAGNGWLTPTLFFVGLWVLVLLAQALPARYAFVRYTVWGGLFAAVGLTGCVLLGLGLFSLHTPAHFNYQLLWLLPTHVAVAFVRPSPRWHLYLTASIVLLLLGSILGYSIYYAHLLPEIGLLQALLLAQLLFFRRQSLSPNAALYALPVR